MNKTERRVAELMESVMPVPWSGCWLWLGYLNADGYGKPRFLGRDVYAHRVFYQHFKGNLSEDDCVLHQCDVRCCVNPAHLSKGSRKDNLDDMWRKGRARPGRVFGEAHGMAKIDAETVRMIRADSRSGVKLARDLKMSRSTVYAIRSRKIWAHLT